MKARERIFLTADKKTAVKEGDSRAAFLLVAPGQEITRATAERYGVSSDGMLSEPQQETEAKESRPMETKERKPEETKPIIPPETKRQSGFHINRLADREKGKK